MTTSGPVVPRAVDLDRRIVDTLHLASLPGVVERLQQQCHDLGPPITSVRRAGDAVVVEIDGALRRPAGLRAFSSAGVLLGDYETARAEGYGAVVERLRQSLATGALGALDPGAITFRVDPFGDRWEFRDLLTDQLGWRNDPHDWTLNFTRFGPWLVAQIGALYHSTRFPALERVPASTNPLIAGVLVQLAKLRPGQRLLDPFCGAGTILVEGATTVPELTVIGSDVSADALSRSATNLRTTAYASSATGLDGFGRLLIRADAAQLPLGDHSVDTVVSNIPFGKRVGSHRGNQQLYPALLRELTRVLTTTGRAVLLTEDKRLLVESVQRTRGLRIVKETEFETGGLHPSAYVLDRLSSTRRRAQPAGRRPRASRPG